VGIRQYPPVNRTGSRVVGYGYFSFPNIRRNPYYLCLYEDRSKSERATATMRTKSEQRARAASLILRVVKKNFFMIYHCNLHQ